MTKRKKRAYAREFTEPSQTQQGFRDMCDVNRLIRSVSESGVDPYAERRARQVFGYATSKTYKQALDEVRLVESAFHELPAPVRAEFQNDPYRWLESAIEPPAPSELVPPAPPPAAPEPQTEPQD